MVEPLPCPFCGEPAELDARQAYRSLVGGRMGTRFAIYCTRCTADMGFCREDIESDNHEAAEQEIITTWNTRQPTDEALATFQSRGDRLAEALDDAINVFDGMCDDEINEMLLPVLRAKLTEWRKGC